MNYLSKFKFIYFFIYIIIYNFSLIHGVFLTFLYYFRNIYYENITLYYSVFNFKVSEYTLQLI